jgi:hypothetical protein
MKEKSTDVDIPARVVCDRNVEALWFFDADLIDLVDLVSRKSHFLEVLLRVEWDPISQIQPEGDGTHFYTASSLTWMRLGVTDLVIADRPSSCTPQASLEVGLR